MDGPERTITSRGDELESSAVPTGDLGRRYALHEVLGEGGAGRVLRAYDRELQRFVALKLLRAGDDASGLLSNRFRREARAHALLQHPNVVSIFDVGEHDGRIFISMELIEGNSMKDWLNEGPSVDAILRAFLDAGSGLLAAHEKGLIHRDFKPSNVLIGTDGRARVADFGLARGLGALQEEEDDGAQASTHAADLSLTRTGTIMGTPAYMAPEQARGESVDGRADQFAFCLSLTEALVTPDRRRLLGTESAEDRARRAREWIQERAVPRRVREVLFKGLAPDPRDRHESLSPILDALRQQLSTSSSWRSVVVLAALVFVCSLGVIGYGRATACSNLDAPLARVWDGTRLGGFALDSAPSEWRPAFRSLNVFAEGWLKARVQVCQATRLRGDQSEQLMDARVDCLDRRLSAMGMFLALVEAGRAGNANGVREAILRLPDPSVCTELRPDSAEAPSPPAGMLESLSELEAMMAAGLFEDGLERSTRLVNSATSAPSYWQGEAQAWKARFLAQNAKKEEASRTWEVAAALAERAAHDELRFTAHVGQLALDEGETADRDRIDRVLARAQALHERMGRGRRQAGNLAAIEAQILHDRGDLVRCREAGEEALVLLVEARAPFFERLAAYENLIECMVSRGDRKEAVAVAERAVREGETKLGPKHPLLVGLESQLSRAHDFSGNRTEAEAAARRALDIALEALGPGHTATGQAYQSLGNAQFRIERFEEGAQNLKRALDIESEANGRTKRLGMLMSSWALFLDMAGRSNEAISQHQRAVAVLEDVAGPTHPRTGAAYGRLGNALHRQGRHAEGLEACRRGRDILARSDPLHARIMDQVRCMADALLAMDRPSEALEVLERGLEISEKRDEPAYYTSMLEFLVARAAWRVGQRDRAVQLARSAADRLESKGVKPEYRAEIEAWLGKPN
ncbi:MAG: serine/threonine-protein kinase [Myxococcota bacterium]